MRQNPAPDDGVFPKDIPIGADGRFRIEGLVPGLQYEGRVADRPGSSGLGIHRRPGRAGRNQGPGGRETESLTKCLEWRALIPCRARFE